jgi:hypothetical protein
MNTEDLNDASSGFALSANRVKRLYWWRNLKVCKLISNYFFLFFHRIFYFKDVDYSGTSYRHYSNYYYR